MNPDPVYKRLRELSWRRPLTESEQAELRAWLAAHPEAQAGWEVEKQLSAMLQQLSGAPVPSNFTARVLQAVGQETAAAGRQPGFQWLVTVASFAPPLFAQTPTNPSVPAAAQTLQADSAPLPPQFTKSPVESFREFLVMPSEERLKSLTVYPPEIRNRILEKIAEY